MAVGIKAHPYCPSVCVMNDFLGYIPRVHFISQPRIKNDGLCFDITDEIVVDVNVAFLVVIHGIAFTDLNFLDQPHQRGTV